jgi:anti-sigma B factor antagonist
MQIKETIQDGIAILKLRGKLMGGPETQELHDHVRGLVADEVKKVVVDLSNVKWVNSSGLGILMASYTTMKNNGGELKLAGVTEKVENLLVITQLMNFFETYETIERAIASFK